MPSVSCTYCGDIDATFVNHLVDILNNHITGHDEFILNLSSCGGGVAYGVTAYNLLKKFPVPVHTHNLGEVSSSAILPFLAGSIRTAEPISKFMLHPFAIPSSDSLSFASVQEKINILVADLLNYSKIVEAEVPAFCIENPIMDILQHRTVILSDFQTYYKYGFTTVSPEASTQAEQPHLGNTGT